MAPPHMQIKTKLKHSTTSLLVAIFTQENLFSILSFMLYLYKSLTRPIVEYGNIIWDPHYVIDQQLSYN